MVNLNSNQIIFQKEKIHDQIYTVKICDSAYLIKNENESKNCLKYYTFQNYNLNKKVGAVRANKKQLQNRLCHVHKHAQNRALVLLTVQLNFLRKKNLKFNSLYVII